MTSSTETQDIYINAPTATFEGTTAEQAFGAIEHARNQFETHIVNLQQNANLYTSDGYNEQVARFKDTPAAKAIDKAEADVQQRLAAAEAKVAKTYKDLSPNGDAAAESRAARYWHRNERLLDSKDDKLHTARQLVENASRDEIGVLLQELPAYLQSFGLSTEWIDEHVARVVPEYGAAKDELKKANAATQLVTNAARMVRQGFDSGRPPGAANLALLNPSTAGKRYAAENSRTVQWTSGKYDPDR